MHAKLAPAHFRPALFFWRALLGPHFFWRALLGTLFGAKRSLLSLVLIEANYRGHAASWVGAAMRVENRVLQIGVVATAKDNA